MRKCIGLFTLSSLLFLSGGCQLNDKAVSVPPPAPTPVQLGRQEGEKLLVATTIDFLDYAFFDKIGSEKYYDLESYERRIREMAQGGIKRINLRVNACGIANYPTKATVMYGEDGRLHWNLLKNAKRFAATLRRYDPCVETIRLGHKYGMEVWCWENLRDECGGTCLPADEPGYEDSIARHRGMPLMEPNYEEHPEWQAMRNPAKILSPEKIAKINAEARKHPISKIIIRDKVTKGQQIRIKPSEVEIYTSMDNKTYIRYTAPFQCRPYQEEGTGFTCYEISGLNISANYVKLAHPTYSDKAWGIAVRERRNCCRVYNTQGEEISTVWCSIVHGDVPKETSSFNFSRFESAAWDYGHYQVGFIVGEPQNDQLYYEGVVEFAVPDAMAYRLRKFKELAAYPFDGYMMNLRTHSHTIDADEYGYNPEVIQATIKRCGKNPVTDDSAKEVLRQIRAEAIADYLKGCKQLIGDRPLYISGLPNKPEYREKVGYQRDYGSINWLYKRYFADGSIDGVIMLGCDFRDEFTPEVLQGRKIKLGVFREMGFPPKGYDLASDLEALRKDMGLNEVELYETMVLSFHPEKFEETKK